MDSTHFDVFFLDKCCFFGHISFIRLRFSSNSAVKSHLFSWSCKFHALKTWIFSHNFTFWTLKLIKNVFNLEFVSSGFDNIEKKSWARTFSKMQIKITNLNVKKNWPSLVWPQNSNKFRENSGLEEFNIFQNSKLKPEIKHKTCLFVVYLIFRKSDWPHIFRNYLSGKFLLFMT